MTSDDLDLMVKQYVETALWSSTGVDEEPLDNAFGPADVHSDTLAAMRADCEDFYQSNAVNLTDMDACQAGHDFWLTRNGHGAGFWDRGLGELGDRLTANSKPYGEFYLYEGDDGMVHGQ